MTSHSDTSAQERNSLDIYLRLLEYAKAHWRMFVISLLGMAGFAAADVSFVALMRPMLDGSFVEKDPQVIARMPWMILGLFVLRGISAFASPGFDR